jgi:hypothetical protein
MSCAWMPSKAPSKTPTIVPTIGFFSRMSLLDLSRAWSLDHLLIGMARHALDICAARLQGFSDQLASARPIMCRAI